MALSTLLTLAAETGQPRFRMLIFGILLLIPGAALASWSTALWSALRYAPVTMWPGWLTRSVPLLLALLGVLTVIPVAAAHILGPPGLAALLARHLVAGQDVVQEFSDGVKLRISA